MSHLSHECGLSTHVWPGDEDAQGVTFVLAAFVAARAADEDVVGNEVVAEKGLGDARVAGSREVDEGHYLVVALGKHQLGPAHWSVSTLTVA